MGHVPYRILIVDDEQDITEFLAYNLNKEGYSVNVAFDGLRAIEIARQQNPHLILLDVMMPEMDGIETCEKLREIPQLNDTIIAFLTARSEDYSQIAGFEAGADDYISKPVRPKVLVSRIRALLKRFSQVQGMPEPVDFGSLNLGSLIIDKERYLVISSGREVTLPRKEFNLLCLLTSKPTRVFTRDEIYEWVWGNDVNVGERTIDVYIRKLREKIGMDCIKTIKGVGYKFEPLEEVKSEIVNPETGL
jgi:two-component system, OmpR family, alkaline phosphatase synthesis response regulator PhoP